MTDKSSFGIGVRVRFRVTGGEVTKGPALYWMGVVNGKPLYDDAGIARFVPVFCEREGREATTIMVAVTNIITAEQP